MSQYGNHFSLAFSLDSQIKVEFVPSAGVTASRFGSLQPFVEGKLMGCDDRGVCLDEGDGTVFYPWANIYKVSQVKNS